jgi:hypothetical protein
MYALKSAASDHRAFCFYELDGWFVIAAFDR